MTYYLHPPTKGSVLIPLRPIELSLLRGDWAKHRNVVLEGHWPSDLVDTKKNIKLEAGKTSLLLLDSKSIKDGILELRCLLEEKTRSIYVKKSLFSRYFCFYPSFLLGRKENLTPDEEWLTRYFGIKGKVLRSHWRHRPQVVFEDYESLRGKQFVTERRLGKNNEFTATFDTKERTDSLGETESVVIGHDIRIRPGTRNLVFEFYHPRTERVAFWEFNERHTPKKSAKLFYDNWVSYYFQYRSGGDYHETLYMRD